MTAAGELDTSVPGRPRHVASAGTDGVSARRTVVRQSGLTSAVAMAAVISGLAFDLVIAARFGATSATDAFVVAARIPLGLLAVLMATANQALVPTFSRWFVNSASKDPSRLVSGVLTWALVAGAAAAGVLALLAPLFAAIVAPGFDATQQQLTVDLIRVFVLVVPLTAGSEVLRAYLNARYSFAVPAGITVVLNAVGAMVVVAAEPDIHVLPQAYLAGAAAQLCVLAAMAWRRGLRFVPSRLNAPELKDTGRLTVRPLFSAALNPLARIAELLVVSFLPAGAMTVLHYANRLVSAIGGTVLFRSVITALVPRLARADAAGNRDEVGALTVLGLQVMLSLSLPLTAALAVLGVPGSRLVFERGRFGAAEATLLGLALAVYAFSFVGSAVQRALLAPFYARLDTSTPLRNTMYGVGSNLALLPVAVLSFSGTAAVLAVAAAYSLSQYVHVGHALYRLRTVAEVNLRPAGVTALRQMLWASGAGLTMAGVAVKLGLYGDPDLGRLVGGLALAGALGLGVILLATAGRRPVVTLARLRRRSRRRAGSSGAPAHPQWPHARHRGRHLAPRRPPSARVLRRSDRLALAALLPAAAWAVVVASTVPVGGDLRLIMLPLAALVALAIPVLALVHIEGFVLVVLLLRSSLDLLKIPGGSAAGVDPAAVLAVVVSVVVGVWLLAQRGAVDQAPALSRLGRTLLIFVAVAALGVVVSERPLASLVEWARLASVAPMLVVVEQLAVRRVVRARILVAIFLAAVVPVAVAVAQVVTGSGLFMAGGFERVRGTFTHSNPFSVFLMMLVVMAVALLPHTRGWVRRGLVASLVATGPILVLTYTRGSWIAAVLGLVVVGLLQSRRLLVGLVIVLLGVALALTRDHPRLLVQQHVVAFDVLLVGRLFVRIGLVGLLGHRCPPCVGTVARLTQAGKPSG